MPCRTMPDQTPPYPIHSSLVIRHSAIHLQSTSYNHNYILWVTDITHRFAWPCTTYNGKPVWWGGRGRRGRSMRNGRMRPAIGRARPGWNRRRGRGRAPLPRPPGPEPSGPPGRAGFFRAASPPPLRFGAPVPGRTESGSPGRPGAVGVASIKIGFAASGMHPSVMFYVTSSP